MRKLCEQKTDPASDVEFRCSQLEIENSIRRKTTEEDWKETREDFFMLIGSMHLLEMTDSVCVTDSSDTFSFSPSV